MSQKSEKYARNLTARMDKLEQDCRFIAALHSISDDKATELRRRTREKTRLARQWRQRCMWLAVVAVVLAVALCLTLKVKADVAPVGEAEFDGVVGTILRNGDEITMEPFKSRVYTDRPDYADFAAPGV